VAELVDAHDSKSCAARRAGSIPALGTAQNPSDRDDLKDFFLNPDRKSNRTNYQIIVKCYLAEDFFS
jgi:hypothetical protein